MAREQARGILRDRRERRRWIARLLCVPLGMLALGLWAVDGWLEESPLRFALWWLGCGVATLVVLLFALHDALSAVREERQALRAGWEEGEAKHSSDSTDVDSR